MKNFGIILFLLCTLFIPLQSHAQATTILKSGIKYGNKKISNKIAENSTEVVIKDIGKNSIKSSANSRLAKHIALKKTLKVLEKEGYSSLMEYSMWNAKKQLLKPHVTYYGKSMVKRSGYNNYTKKLKSAGKASKDYVKRTTTRLLISSRDQFITAKEYLTVLAHKNIVLKLGWPKDAKVLRENMLKCMTEKARRKIAQNGSMAHHIVGNSTPNAAMVLKKYGIDINDPMNGIFLPSSEKSGLKGTIHCGGHTNDYYNYIEESFSICKSKEDCYELLDMIKKDLYNGKIKLYSPEKNKVNKIFTTKKAA